MPHGSKTQKQQKQPSIAQSKKVIKKNIKKKNKLPKIENKIRKDNLVIKQESCSQTWRTNLQVAKRMDEGKGQFRSLRLTYTHCYIVNEQSTRTYFIAQGTCSMLCGSLDEKGVQGRMDTWIRMAESLHYSPETITTLLVNQLYPNTR